MVLPLDKYACETVAGMIQDGQPATMLSSNLSLDLKANHAAVFQHLLWTEESQMHIDIRHYDMEEAVMKPVPGGYLTLKVKDFCLSP